MEPTWPLAYAADFVSYVLQKLSAREAAMIELIALFGSAARGDTTRDSDVDLFIQSPNTITIERKVAAILNDFEKSTRVLDYWRPLGVRLPINVKVGRTPTAFAVIPDALHEHGKVLYAPYRSSVPKSRKSGIRGVVFSWENIEKPSSRANINRNLFGYESHGKEYPGLVARVGGRRLGKGSIWLPLEHLVEVERLFRKNRVTCRLMRVVSDE
jgi:predicted nucleotidyltransferase